MSRASRLGVVRAGERGGRHAGGGGAGERLRARLVRADRDDLGLAAVHAIEDGLEVRARAGGEDADRSRDLELREAPAGGAQAAGREQRVHRAQHVLGAQVAVRAVARAARRRSTSRSPSSGRRAGSRRSGCGPTPGSALATTSRIAPSRSPAGASARWRGAAGRGRARASGSHTSQHGPVAAGAAPSPKWRRMPSRRQLVPSTQAQTARYWRQRMARALVDRRVADRERRRGPTRRRRGPRRDRAPTAPAG